MNKVQLEISRVTGNAGGGGEALIRDAREASARSHFSGGHNIIEFAGC